jgi:hypothetical protein
MDFWLGGDVHWLPLGLPLMVSHRRLRRRVTLPRATAPWVCDSGGFTELSTHGQWTISPDQYVTGLRRYRDEVGLLEWAAPQDWMCEPWITAKTGRSVAEHQRATTDNLVELRTLAPELPIIPVLQGWVLGDYLRHLDDYATAGIDLTAAPLVGLGTVCSREATAEIGAIVWTLARAGLRLHGFGVKLDGLRTYGHLLASADSMAGSYGARRRVGRCPHGVVAWEANCPQWARQWRGDVLAGLAAPYQPDLFAQTPARVAAQPGRGGSLVAVAAFDAAGRHQT